jgi:hypothetical protein
MQSRISPKSFHPGHPPMELAATTIDPRANGRANTVCENRMNVRNRERGVKRDRDNKSRTQVLTLEANTINIHNISTLE